MKACIQALWLEGHQSCGQAGRVGRGPQADFHGATQQHCKSCLLGPSPGLDEPALENKNRHRELMGQWTVWVKREAGGQSHGQRGQT